MLKRFAAMRTGHVAEAGTVQRGRGDGTDHYIGQCRQTTTGAHDVFIVIGEGVDGARVARTVYAGSEDDARQTHQENYADELIVAIQQ